MTTNDSTNQMQDDLAEAFRANAMLVDMSRSMWPLTQPDHLAAAAAEVALNTKSGAIDATKNRLFTADQNWKLVATELNKAYNQHREMTTEWGAGGKRGARLLANASWLNYVQAVGNAQKKIDVARDKFMASFDADVVKAKLALGDAAPTRYPSAMVAGAAFQLHIDFIPIAKGSTPVGLPEGAPKWLAERYAEKTASNASTAMDAVIGRVREYTNVLLDNINAEREFRSSSLDNITGLVPMLEAFSFTGDPRFAELAVEIETRIGAYDLKSIKKEGKAAAKGVKAILDTMDAWAVEADDGAEEEDEATESDAA